MKGRPQFHCDGLLVAEPTRFPRTERLTRKSEYARVFQQGEKWVGRHFICYVVRHEAPGSKLGLAVSRKVGKSVVRNRVKRYLREFYRTHRPQFQANVHVAVIARPACNTLSYAECVSAMERLFRQGGLLGD